MLQNKQIAVFTGLAAAAVAVLGAVIYQSQPKGPQPAVEASAPAATAPQVSAPPPTTPAPSQPAAEVAVKAPEPVAAPATPQPAQPAPASPLPAFDTVRVEPNGEAVIAGRAEPGAEVVVRFNGEVVGQAVANAEGAFAIVPEKPLQKGTGALTLLMSKNGAVTQSAESVVVAVTQTAPALVAKIDPAAPTQVTQVPAAAEGPPPATVQLNAVDYDAAGNIVFSGRAKPGATVRFYVDNSFAGDAAADASGRWQFKGSATMPPGEHTLRADQVDSSGKVTSRIELPFLRETEEAVAALKTAPVPAPVAADAQPAKPGTKIADAAVIVPERLVIQPGHNLWRLSRQIYGRGKLYTVIYEANRDQLRNPHRIYPGQILAAPQNKNN